MLIILFRAVQIFFSAYTILLIARIVASWFPNLFRFRIMHFVCYYTDPYLNFFRRIIPPLGGVLDISPILAFIALQILEHIVVRILFMFG